MMALFSTWDWCYLHWHPHYSVFRRLRLIGGLNQYYCFTWIQSILSLLLLVAFSGSFTSPSIRSSKGSWKALPWGAVWRLWWQESFIFLLHGGSSAGAALELPHRQLAPGAATKSGVQSQESQNSHFVLGSRLKPPSHSNVKSKRCIYPLWSLADPVLLSWFLPVIVLGLSLSHSLYSYLAMAKPYMNHRPV